MRRLRSHTWLPLAVVSTLLPLTALSAPPVSPNINAQEFTEGVSGNFTVPAFSDPEGEALSYSYEGLPTWLSVYNPSANPRYLLGTPPYTESGPSSNKTYWVTVTATDPQGESASKSFSVTVLQANGPPQRPDSIPAQTVNEQQYFSYSVPVFPDPDGDTVSYAFSGLPSWLTVYNPASNPRYLYGRPPYSESGPNVDKVYYITVTASDPAGASSSRAFQLTVRNVNAIPEAPVIPDQEYKEGRYVAYAVPRFYDADGDILTYDIQGLPSWLSLYNPEKNPRFLYGRVPAGDAAPGDSREYPITVTATDPSGAFATQNWTLRTLASDLRALPVRLSFGDQEVGTASASQAVTVYNNSAQSFNIASITLEGPDSASFSQSNTCPATLAASSTCTINVSFAPTAVGSRTAFVKLISTIGASYIGLTGSGVDAAPPSVTLTASAQAVSKGNNVTLQWSSENATSCEAGGGWSGTKATTGSQAVGPLTVTTEFTLTCSGSGGSGDSAVTVQVNSVSGTIYLPAYSRYDRDTNDTSAPFQSNDDWPVAQPVSNPVRLGGYVNDALKGPDGRSYSSGDFYDVYSVNMAAGQVVEMTMPTADESLPDDTRDDADLYLYLVDPNNPNSAELVATSLEYGPFERVVAPDNGRYYVEVVLYTGSVIYNLTIGQQSTASTGTAGTLNVANDFRSGEAILKMRKGLSKSAAASRLGELQSHFGVRMKRGAADREMLFELPLRSSGPVRGVRPLSSTVRERGWRMSADTQRKLDTLQLIKLLGKEPGVEHAHVNMVMRSQAVPNDPLYGYQRWHYEMMGLPAAWNVTTGSASVVVAVVDSGVVNHPDLVANLVPGYDFIADPTNDDGDGIDSNADDPGCALGGSSSFHGTHVAGTVAAASNNGVGVSGVSWSSKIMPLRVLNGCEGTGSSYDVVQGIRYAAGLSNDSGTLPTRRADIINLSLGSETSCPGFYADLFNSVRAQGVITVAAAGNNNTSLAFSPASCPNVISVSSLDPTRSRAYYSNYGSTVDIAAPGGDVRYDRDGNGLGDGIFSTVANGGGANRTADYTPSQGTSMAAPGVAGVMALMKSVNPALTPADVDNLLAQGALSDDIGPEGPDELGVGLINAFKAVQAAGGPPPATPLLVVSPTSVNYGDVNTDAQIVLTNAGSGSIVIDTYTRSANWMELFNIGADPSTFLGPWLIRVDRTGLAPGIYQGWMDFNWSGGSARVNLTMEVAEAPTSPDVGFQYVLLVEADSGELADVGAGHLEGSDSLPYTFDTAVVAQDYLLYSGTDMNNDFYICDDGEACGAHPTELRPERFRIEGDTSGVDFATGFRTSVQSNAATMAPLLVRDARKLPERTQRAGKTTRLKLGE